MEEKNGVSQETNQFVSFTLSEEEYGIPILRVQEIIRYTELTRIPQSSDFIEGVLNLRGQVIPVVDLRRRFQMSEYEHSMATRIVVVEIGQQTLGLIVDSVSEVRTIEKGQVDPPPPLGAQIDNQFIYGMGKLEDRLVILLDLDKIFTTEEQDQIAKAQDDSENTN